MIRHIDDRLVRAAHQLRLILDPQNNNLLAVLRLLADGIDDARLNGAGETLIAVRAHEGELYALPAVDLTDSGDRSDPDGRRAIPDLLSPADDAAVEVVGPVVGCEGVRLAAVEAVELGALDAVRYAADGLAEERVVVLFVLGLLGEALDDV